MKEITPDETKIIESVLGKRVNIVGDHPWTGNSGIIVRFEKTPFGIRPVVRLDIGHECFVFQKRHWRSVYES